MAAIYKTLIQTSLSGSSQRVALGLAAVPNATASAENDVEEVRSIIRNLTADEDSLRPLWKQVERLLESGRIS